MAYKSLYRAYRPQTFEDVSGQQAIITTLQNAVKENRIAHAYLFCGPRGTGKTTVAKLLAKAINCNSDIENKPCGECENCKAIELGSHPDVIEIDAASNNGVEEVRDLIDKVKYAPTQGKYKVYIIDEVHMMTPGAFNALLKTLEEPPAHVVFILATTEPHKILPTIISRCQRFDFSRLTEKEMVERMQTVCKEENKQCDVDALALIAKLANGGMRDALSILEQCLAYNDDHLTIEDVNAIYGIVSMSKKLDLIKVILSSKMAMALNILEEMDNKGIDIKRLTYDLIDILKDVVIYKNTNNLDILMVLTESDLKEIIPFITSDEALNFIDILMEAIEKYAKAINPHIYFELAILKLCNQDHSVREVPVQVKEVEPVQPITVAEYVEPVVEEKPVEPVQVEEAVTKEVTVEEPPHFEFIQEETVDTYSNDEDIQVDVNDIMNILVQANRTILNDIQEKWPVIKRYMANMNTAKAASMLAHGKPVAACSDAFVIAYEHMPDVNAVNYYKNYKQLASLIKDVLGHDYRFVAMRQDEWINLRSKFIQLNRQKALPEPAPIVLKHIDKYDIDHVELNEAQQFAIDMFGRDLVEFTED